MFNSPRYTTWYLSVGLCLSLPRSLSFSEAVVSSTSSLMSVERRLVDGGDAMAGGD